MGAVNYKTSDYITLGYNCNDIDYEEYEFSTEIIQEYFDQIRYVLNEKRFYYFHISIEPGYYDGYSIDIEYNYPICIDSYEDKKEAQKEITQIKSFLLECINNFECVAVYPGWCTRYEDYLSTLKKLNVAIKEMRETVKNTPTYNNYERGR